jgi:hypothetical protein
MDCISGDECGEKPACGGVCKIRQGIIPSGVVWYLEPVYGGLEAPDHIRNDIPAEGFGVSNNISPCPFCGGVEGDDVFLGYEYPKYRIACVPCDIVMRDDRKDKVIANWNNRIH